MKDQTLPTDSPLPEARGPRLFAFISDIHGNIDALEAVLEDIAKMGCETIFCLGDIVGYGPEPAACVQAVRERCVASVFGNHEAFIYMAEQYAPGDMPASIGKPIELAIAQLTPDQMKWLKELPAILKVGPITLSHGSLHEPLEFFYLMDQEETLAHFKAQSSFLSFNGHSHVPCVWEEAAPGDLVCFAPAEKPVRLNPDRRYSINVGSVGQPRDNDPRSCYALYNLETHLLVHRRVSYDISKAQARFRKAELPEKNARRIQLGF